MRSGILQKGLKAHWQRNELPIQVKINSQMNPMYIWVTNTTTYQITCRYTHIPFKNIIIKTIRIFFHEYFEDLSSLGTYSCSARGNSVEIFTTQLGNLVLDTVDQFHMWHLSCVYQRGLPWSCATKSMLNSIRTLSRIGLKIGSLQILSYTFL